MTLAVLALVACATAPVTAQDAKGPAAFRMAVLAGEGARDPVHRLEPFRAYLADKLGVSVGIGPLREGQAAIDGLATQRIDYTILSASAFAQASRACACVEAIAVPRSAAGGVAWASVLMVRAESAANAPADLKGQTLAAAPARSFAGRTFPLAALEMESAGFATGLGHIETVAGPADAVRLLMERKADAALAWIIVDEAGRRVAGGPLAQLDPATYRIVWTGPSAPLRVHAVRKSLPAAQRARLSDLLLHLAEAEPDLYDLIEPDFDGGFIAPPGGALDGMMKVLAGP